MKKKIIILLGILVPTVFFSCKKFLDVQPKEEVLESELLRSPAGVYSMLNGIYQGIADQRLYGRELTIGYLDVLAQYYVHKYTGPYPSPTALTNKDTESLLSAIWQGQYSLLLEINVLLKYLADPDYKVLPLEEKNLLQGELYALRAFIHFDLLRLFGPLYNQQPEAPAIPYISQPDIKVQPILPALAVVKQLQQDLELSLKFLKNDPVLQYTAGPVRKNPMNYFSLRYYRFNYYAALLLSARINLYAGDWSQALLQATDLIQATEVKFPFVANQAQAMTDPVFSSEALFAIQNQTLNTIYNEYFNPTLPETHILAPDPNDLAVIYPSQNDCRYLAWSSPGTIAEKTYRVFSKYNNIPEKIAANLIAFQPLIRKSEAYLIAAEAEADLNKAYNYLNRLQIARGIEPDIPPVPNRTALLETITAEYMREFWGEGQLFFYFKRKNISTSPTGAHVPLFIPPIPKIETDMR